MKRFAAILLVLLMLASFIAPLFVRASEADYKDQIKSLGDEYAQLEKEQAAIQANLNKTTNQKAQEQAKKTAVDTQVQNTTQQINVLNQQIDLLNENITQKELEITEKQVEIDKNYGLMKDRLRAMYMTGEESLTGLLLGAESFFDFLTRAEVTNSVAAHDREMLNWLDTELMAIRDDKAEIEQNKTEVENFNSALDEKKQQLTKQSAEIADSIQSIAALEAKYRQNANTIKAEMAAVQAELDKIYSQIKSEGDYSGGIMAWPMPTFSTITSDYGYRTLGGVYEMHTGVDISGRNYLNEAPYGKPIVAVADGKVAFVAKNYVPNRGYGMYLIVDHGGGISTLYAHCSEINVSLGQQVSRGQTIAGVGSTGYSTGPHLHFEVRENGKHVTPWKYLR